MNQKAVIQAVLTRAESKMFGLKRKTFWTILVGVNMTSAMICMFSRNTAGSLFSIIAVLSCYYMLAMCEREDN